ncbi:hypothetical protein ACVWZA_000640 [Sphingomonas sp. UYAg733]
MIVRSAGQGRQKRTVVLPRLERCPSPLAFRCIGLKAGGEILTTHKLLAVLAGGFA